MTQLLNVISSSEKQKILDKLSALQDVCRPAETVSRPTFHFKKKEDFVPVLDDFHCGYLGTYTISPDQLKTYFYEDRQTLRDSCVDFIQAGPLKWYYNTSDIIGNFFSEDGQKKVEVEFNFWSDAERVWSVPGLKQAMRGVLKKCSGEAFPKQSEIDSFFDEELCRKIYNRDPSKKSIKQAIVELVEPLRKALYAELVKTKVPDIAKTQGFKKYVKAKPNGSSQPVQNLVQEYLKKNKNAIYLLGEKFNFIKKAPRMIHYQNMRDSVRHPSQISSTVANAQRIYQDFCEALGLADEKSGQEHLQTFIDNTEVFDNLEYMSKILDILNIYGDKTLPKNKSAYWQDLVQKGILEQSEVPYLQTMILECNTVAHGNENADASKATVANEGALIQISMDMAERHETKQRQKQSQIHRWIEENSFKP